MQDRMAGYACASNIIQYEIRKEISAILLILQQQMQKYAAIHFKQSTLIWIF
jgi:hypothetical protein